MYYCRLTLFISSAMLLVTAACTKKKDTAAQNVPGVTVPNGRHPDIWYLMGTKATTLSHSVMPNVWAVLNATELTSMMKDTAGMVHSQDLKWQGANFTHVNAFDATVGSITVNSAPVVIYKGFYTHPDSTNTWHTNSSNHWEVADNNNATVVSADVQGSFPMFTGSLPDSISRNAALTYTFAASNCSNADSAQIILYTDGFILESAMVNAHGGTAVIAQSRVSTMKNWPFVYMNNWFHGGLFEIVLYNHTIRTNAGKRFAFVNQKEILKTIVFY